MGDERPSDAAGQSGDPRSWFTVSALPVALAAVAALAYGILHTAAEEFYGPFGVSPEDAGLDRVTLLVRSASLLGFCIVGYSLVFMWMMVVRRFLLRFTKVQPESWTRSAVALTLSLGGVFAAVSLASAPRDSRTVRGGTALVKSVYGIPWTPYRATIADIHWRSGAPTALARIKCALVIGSTGGYSLVYSPGVGTFRVAPDNGVVVLHPQSGPRCPLR